VNAKRLLALMYAYLMEGFVVAQQSIITQSFATR